MSIVTTTVTEMLGVMMTMSVMLRDGMSMSVIVMVMLAGVKIMTMVMITMIKSMQSVRSSTLPRKYLLVPGTGPVQVMIPSLSPTQIYSSLSLRERMWKLITCS